MTEEEKLTASEFYSKMFENIPTVSMKVFSYENINITDADVARAERYKMWCNGNAYIPLQDIVLYERSYQKINELNKNFK